MHIQENWWHPWNKQVPLTQIDYGPDPSNGLSSITTLTSKADFEEQILLHNRRHSLQSLDTPFFTNPILQGAINPENDRQIEKLINGTFLDEIDDSTNISPTERLWISSLKKKHFKRNPTIFIMWGFSVLLPGQIVKNIIFPLRSPLWSLPHHA